MNRANEVELLYEGDRLEDLLDLLDELHSAASENRLQNLTTLSKPELLGMLQDVIYTAQETIREMETPAARAKRRAKITPLVPFGAPVGTPDAVQEPRHA